MSEMVWDSPAMVRWSPEMSSDQVGGTGKDAETKNFPDLRSALNFVIEELEATPRMNVGVYPERGSALISLAYIEQAYRSRPMPDGEPGGAA